MASGSSRNNGLTLTDMPNEILRNIASRLELKEWRLWFVKTSRQCREIGEAILYQDWKEKSEYHEGHADIYLYLRTLLNRPDLAKHVNTFTGDGVGYAEEPNEEWMSLKDTIFDKSDWNRIEEIIRSRWRGHEQSKLLEGLRAGEWDPAVTLLYSLMPNLEEISLGKWYECGPILSGYIEQAGLCQRGIETSLEISSAVPKLSKVSLQFHDTEGGMEPSELHMWSALKSMRVLQGHMIGDDNQEDPDSEFSDGKTPRNEEQSRCMVEKLVFTYSTIDANGLADILFAYPHLKHFEYDYGGAMVAAAAFEPPKIRRALLEVKDTLEYLSLKDDDGNKEDDLSGHPMGSFKDFPNLEIIATEATILLGAIEHNPPQPVSYLHGYPSYISLVNVLPPNIEQLILTGCDTTTAQHLIELVKKIHLFPRLKTLDLDIFTTQLKYASIPAADIIVDGFTVDEETEFRRLCAEAGMQMKHLGRALDSDGHFVKPMDEDEDEEELGEDSNVDDDVDDYDGLEEE